MERPSVLFRISSVIFRCQKYVKKGYIEMRKRIYLVPLKTAMGHSILHYSGKAVIDYKTQARRMENSIINDN